VAETSDVIDSALDAVRRHPLRSLDALQLASAIVIRGSSAELAFVTLDIKLAAAARADGFAVLP
jgi:predicted nucleic acid-binding protein